uniref:Uncharacterized protein n=1 Tax=Glossina austeni TaxID=7395 RepID=A0A1A9UZ90_GLOAU
MAKALKVEMVDRLPESEAYYSTNLKDLGNTLYELNLLLWQILQTFPTNKLHIRVRARRKWTPQRSSWKMKKVKEIMIQCAVLGHNLAHATIQIPNVTILAVASVTMKKN